MRGPLLYTIEVVVVATYSNHVSLAFNTYATLIINSVEVYDLIVEINKGLWVDSLYNGLRGRWYW
jgi:hypothetical protein